MAQVALPRPFFGIDPQDGNWSPTVVLTKDLARVRNSVWGGTCPSRRSDALGSGYSSEDAQRMLMMSASGASDWLTVSIRRVVSPHAPSTEEPREVLLWLDAFHVIELSELDARCVALFERDGSFRNLLLEEVRRFSQDRHIPDLLTLPPHFSDGGAS